MPTRGSNKRGARRTGYAVHGDPRRRPKHFEIAATRGSRRYELRVTLDGDMGREKRLTEGQLRSFYGKCDARASVQEKIRAGRD